MKNIMLVMYRDPFIYFHVSAPENGKNGIGKKIVDAITQYIACISNLDEVGRENITTVFIF